MKKKLNKYDIALISLIIVASISIIIYFGRSAANANNKIAYIYSNNTIVSEYVLTDDVTDEYKVETETGYNTLHIQDGQIWIHEASCPDQVCVHQGKISRDGEIIVCLPNQMLVKIVDNTEDDEMDFIAN